MSNLVTHNTSMLISRIQRRVAELQPGSPNLLDAFTRIGLYVSSLAKINVRKQNLIDTGRLINSIRYEFFKEGKTEGVQVGSFNVPYAAVHEFGYKGIQQIREFTRVQSTAFGRPIEPRNVKVSAHSRRVNIRERAYLRPALATSNTFILDTLRTALNFTGS